MSMIGADSGEETEVHEEPGDSSGQSTDSSSESTSAQTGTEASKTTAGGNNRSTPSGGKSKSTAEVLAVLGGTFGLHMFYLGRILTGLKYAMAFWTFIPTIAGFRDAYRLSRLSERGFDQMYNDVNITDGVEKWPLIAESMRGRVELHENYVKIIHRGRGTKQIPLNRINAVQFRGARGVEGYIQFEQTMVQSLSRSASSAKRDDNSLVFKSRAESQFRQFRDAVNAQIHYDEEEEMASEPEQLDDPGIVRLRELFAEGEISRSEYEERLAVLEGS